MMKYRIVFSIPVHEHFEVVLDQIINFLHFNDGCAVVLHISKSFVDKDGLMSEQVFLKKVEELNDVYINPNRLQTKRIGILQAHLSNFVYISSLCDFVFFSMNASNELFVKRGLFDRMCGFDCAVQMHKNSKVDWAKKVLEDDSFMAYLNKAGGVPFVTSQIEGSYYRKSLFESVLNEIHSFYDYRQECTLYPREEVYFPTIVSIFLEKNDSLKVDSEHLYTFIPWKRLSLLVDISDIKRIVLPSTDRYSVKRIKREINDYIRAFIRQKGGYFKIVQSLVPDANRLSLMRIRAKDCYLSARMFFFTVKANLKVLLGLDSPDAY